MKKLILTAVVLAVLAVPSQARERGPIMSRLLGPKKAHCQVGPVRTAVGGSVVSLGQAIQTPMIRTCPFGGCR